METPITRAEHEEFRRRMEEEHKRQDARLALLEESTQRQSEMLSSIQKLAVNMESMQKELTKQGERLETLESRDGEMWRRVAGYVLTAVIGVVLGFVFRQFGM